MSKDLTAKAVAVGIVAAEPIRRVGLTSAFDGHAEILPVLGNLDAILADPEIHHLILDLSQSTSWLETLTVVRRMRPDMRQIVLGPLSNDELVIKSIIGGARAYLDANSGPLAVRQAVEAVVRGSIWAPRRLLSILVDRLLLLAVAPPAAVQVLSPRERQVLDLILTARSNREIAAELKIEERTVKAYVASLMRKTGADNRVALSVLATHEAQREIRNSYPGSEVFRVSGLGNTGCN